MEQDYIKRLIEEIGRILGKIASDIIGLKNQGQVGEVYEIVRQNFKAELDFDMDQLLAIDNENLIRYLTEEKGFSTVDMEKLADIWCMVAEDTTRERQFRLWTSGLTLYEYVEETGGTYSIERNGKMEWIRGVLRDNFSG